jgi:hypothetical protein
MPDEFARKGGQDTRDAAMLEMTEEQAEDGPLGRSR